MTQRFLKYLELLLTAAGIVIVAVVFVVFRHLAPWKAAALCAVGVGALHGFIFFWVRSAQRKARNRALQAIPGTLDDLVRNKLQVVLFAAEVKGEDWRPAAQNAVLEIQARLDMVEAEVLTTKGMQ